MRRLLALIAPLAGIYVLGGQCSTPRGTTNTSPADSSMSRSRSWMVRRIG